jgi:broad specificity phosphatase PhoE
MASVRTLLCLIRHGETTWNRTGRWQGHADSELTAAGIEQARQLAQSLVAEHGRRPWSRLFASDLIRGRETASLIASALGLPLDFDRRLRELDVGRWSGLTRPEIEALDPETLRAFESGAPGVRPGGGESRIEIRERSHAFVRAVAERYPGEHLLVVTHLGVIRALVPGARPQNAERFEVCAEELSARPVDREQRREEGPL